MSILYQFVPRKLARIWQFTYYIIPVTTICQVITGMRLGDRDSNPDSTVQSRVSYHWTISQEALNIIDRLNECKDDVNNMKDR